MKYLMLMITAIVIASCGGNERQVGKSVPDYFPDERVESTSEITPAEQHQIDSVNKVYRDVKTIATKYAQETWPDDYTTQEYWVDQQLRDFSYMDQIPSDDPIKKRAERSWPNDYTTQKFWYDEQIDAKKRLGN